MFRNKYYFSLISLLGGLGLSILLKRASYSDVTSCVTGAMPYMGKTGRRRRSVPEIESGTTIRKKRSSWDENADVSVARLSYMIDAITNYEELIILTYGNEIWIHTNCTDCDATECMSVATQEKK